MKRVVLATVAVIGLAAGSATGADLPARMYKAAPPPPPPCAQFGGIYIGGQVGWAYYDHTWNDRDSWSAEEETEGLPRGNVHASESGFIGGVQGGWGWQSNCTFWGVEADYNWASIDASVLETDGEQGIDIDTLSVSSKLRGFGTLRTRAGVVVSNLLLYVTGGLAFADFRRSYTLTNFDDDPAVGAETFEASHTRWGWTAGFGTEWAFTPNWSIKSEVLYARFENDELTFTCANPAFCSDPQTKRFDHHDSVWTTRIGINYRFGDFGKGPIVARY